MFNLDGVECSLQACSEDFLPNEILVCRVVSYEFPLVQQWSTLQNVIDTYKSLPLGHRLLWLLQWLQRSSICTRNTQDRYLHCCCSYYHSNRLWKCSAWFAQKRSESAKIALTLGSKRYDWIFKPGLWYLSVLYSKR